MRKLASIYWLLGMSLRCVALALTPFGIRRRHRSGWRGLQEQANLLEPRQRWKPVRGLGVDGAYPLLNGKKRAVLMAVDLGDGRPVAVGQGVESNPQAVRRFLEPWVPPLGVSVLVTDDLSSFRPVAGKLGLEQQVCPCHLRRRVHHRLPP